MRSEMSCIIGGMQEPKDDDVRETLLRGLDLQMKNTNRHHQINSSPTKEGYYILVIYSMHQYSIYKLHKLHTAVYTYGTYSTYTKVKWTSKIEWQLSTREITLGRGRRWINKKARVPYFDRQSANYFWQCALSPWSIFNTVISGLLIIMSEHSSLS